MMRRRLCCLAVLVVALSPPVAFGLQTEFDATIATVNGDLILKTDILWNLALDPDVAPAEFWDAKTQDMMLRTLIDQRLLLQEAAKLPSTRVSTEEVQDEIQKLAAQMNPPDDTTRFSRRLDLVGLTSDRLVRIVRNRLRILKFVDFRFRSFVVVTEPEIQSYFDAEVKPEYPNATQAELEAALKAQHDTIERLLVEEKINNAIDVYLDEARARAEIVRLDEPPQPAHEAGGTR